MQRAPHPIDSRIWTLVAGRLRVAERPTKVARARRRPDVSGYFAVALVSALASGFLFAGDLLREQVAMTQILAFASDHPMSYIFGFCVAFLTGLLAVGDV